MLIKTEIFAGQKKKMSAYVMKLNRNLKTGILIKKESQYNLRQNNMKVFQMFWVTS